MKTIVTLGVILGTLVGLIAWITSGEISASAYAPSCGPALIRDVPCIVCTNDRGVSALSCDWQLKEESK